jgi:sodium-dependent dicarboxylate transporter 2/3/5
MLLRYAHSPQFDIHVRWRRALAAVLAAVLLYFLIPEAVPVAQSADLVIEHRTRLAVSLTVFLLLSFILRPVPFYVTSLLPLILFPLFGLGSFQGALSAYGSDFALALGCALLYAAEMHYRKLDERIACVFLQSCGPNQRSLLLNGIVIAGFFSMWYFNGLVGALALPVLLSVRRIYGEYLRTCEKERIAHFFSVFVIGIAFAVTIGGISNVLGHPINIALYRFSKLAYGNNLSPTEWLMMGLTFFCFAVFCTYFLLSRSLAAKTAPQTETKFFYFLIRENKSLGRMKKTDAVFIALLGLTLCGWLVSSVVHMYFAATKLPQFFSSVHVNICGILLLAALHAAEMRIDRRRMAESIRMQPWWVLLFLGACFAIGQILDVSGVVSGFATIFAYLLQTHTAAAPALLVAAALILGNVMPTVSIGSLLTLFFGTLLVLVPEAGQETAVMLTLVSSSAFLIPTGSLQSLLFYSAASFRMRDFFKYGILLCIILLPILITLPRYIHTASAPLHHSIIAEEQNEELTLQDAPKMPSAQKPADSER